MNFFWRDVYKHLFTPDRKTTIEMEKRFYPKVPELANGFNLGYLQKHRLGITGRNMGILHVENITEEKISPSNC